MSTTDTIAAPRARRDNPIPPWNRFAVNGATAAEMMGCSREKFSRLVKAGVYPGPRVDRLWNVDDLREALHDAKSPTGTTAKPAYERRPRQVPLGPGVTHLYRHFDAAGQLLYVGISLSAIARLGEHKQSSHWFWQIARIEVTAYATRAAAAKAERLTIARERPMHNVVHARKP